MVASAPKDIAIWFIAADGSLDAESVPVRKIGGLHKLVQRVVIGLLTPADSIPAHAGYGTNFIDVIRAQGLAPVVVHYAFGLAERQLAAQLSADEETDPAAEYSHSVLDDVSIAGNVISLAISVFNVEGDYQQVSFSLSME